MKTEIQALERELKHVQERLERAKQNPVISHEEMSELVYLDRWLTSVKGKLALDASSTKQHKKFYRLTRFRVITPTNSAFLGMMTLTLATYTWRPSGLHLGHVGRSYYFTTMAKFRTTSVFKELEAGVDLGIENKLLTLAGDVKRGFGEAYAHQTPRRNVD